MTRTFDEWTGYLYTRFTGVARMPSVSGNTVRDMLNDWAEEREQLLNANEVIGKDNSRLFGEVEQLEAFVKETGGRDCEFLGSMCRPLRDCHCPPCRARELMK